MQDNYEFPLARVELFNWLLLAALGIACWLTFSGESLKGLLVGGFIANLSFMALKRDLSGIFNGPPSAVKFRFFLKYYLRLSVLAVALYFLVRYWHIHIFGLLTGLSTVVFSITTVAVSEARKIFLSAKEAA